MSLPSAWLRIALAALLILRCIAAHPQSAGATAIAAAASPADAGTLIVQARPVAQALQAYGEVQLIAVTQVRAVEAGVVRGLPLPGQPVSGGEVLAILGGPQARSLLTERRGALRAAAIGLQADRRKLALQLVTQQTVAADEAAFEAARSRLQVALQTLTSRAPARGQVLSVTAADGEQVAAGQLLLTLQTGRPWLGATFYGADALAIHPGMTGRFQETSGAAVTVRVRTVSQAVGPDGGEQVGLVPVLPHDRDAGAPASPWRSGEWGTVVILGRRRWLPVVPSRALILDRAHWWVLVRTPRGDHRQEVLPGPTRGWMTYVARGLRPGQRVVVENAYLEFHRGIARHYTPPD
jgi:HlyD family secretion protein